MQLDVYVDGNHNVARHIRTRILQPLLSRAPPTVRRITLIVHPALDGNYGLSRTAFIKFLTGLETYLAPFSNFGIFRVNVVDVTRFQLESVQPVARALYLPRPHKRKNEVLVVETRPIWLEQLRTLSPELLRVLEFNVETSDRSAWAISYLTYVLTPIPV